MIRFAPCKNGIYLWGTGSLYMMTSSNGNIFHVTGPLCGEFTGPGEFPTQKPVTRSFDVFFDLRLNKRLIKQSWGWWFETLSCPLWRQCNDHHKPSYVINWHITGTTGLPIELGWHVWRLRWHNMPVRHSLGHFIAEVCFAATYASFRSAEAWSQGCFYFSRIPMTKSGSQECMLLSLNVMVIDVLIIGTLWNSKVVWVEYYQHGLDNYSLQWRHNERDAVPNHRRLDCLHSSFFKRRWKKASKPHVTGLGEGNSPVTGEFPA